MTETSFEIQPASAFSSSQIADLLTQAYKDYPLPVFANDAIFKRMVYEWDIRLAHSPIAVVDGQPVGLALLAQRETRGWICGVGVLPAYRRRGITHAMFAYLQRQARALGLRELSLDVLEGNDEAITLYQRVGFTHRRTTLTLLKFLIFSEPIPPQDWPVAPVDTSFALTFYDTFHPAPAPAPWIRDLPSLQKLSNLDLVGFGCFENNTLAGYALYTHQLGITDVYDLAVNLAHPKHKTLTLALLREVERVNIPFNKIYIRAMLEDAPLLPICFEAGYGIYYREYEMCWSVPDEEEHA